MGGVALVTALLMLILGQTVLQPALAGIVFLLYWLVCLALTGLAILAALVDVRVTSLELKRQNRALLEQTVREIQADAMERHKEPKQAKGNPGPKPHHSDGQPGETS